MSASKTEPRVAEEKKLWLIEIHYASAAFAQRYKGDPDGSLVARAHKVEVEYLMVPATWYEDDFTFLPLAGCTIRQH